MRRNKTPPPLLLSARSFSPEHRPAPQELPRGGRTETRIPAANRPAREPPDGPKGWQQRVANKRRVIFILSPLYRAWSEGRELQIREVLSVNKENEIYIYIFLTTKPQPYKYVSVRPVKKSFRGTAVDTLNLPAPNNKAARRFLLFFFFTGV